MIDIHSHILPNPDDRSRSPPVGAEDMLYQLRWHDVKYVSQREVGDPGISALELSARSGIVG
jgi:hypothetical protein